MVPNRSDSNAGRSAYTPPMEAGEDVEVRRGDKGVGAIAGERERECG